MFDINIIFNILLSDNILAHESELFELIPELKSEKGFEQKNEWHCFDVWDHTLATINACDMNPEDRLVMLLHDIGKPILYQDDGNIRHFKGHAKKSAEIAKIVLDRFNISDDLKNMILKLIELHSTTIDVNSINLNNIDFYKRLLKIQMCDAKGYEEEHSKLVLQRINDVNSKLMLKETHLWVSLFFW